MNRVYNVFLQPKSDISTLDRLCRLNGINGKSNGVGIGVGVGVHTDGMVNSLIEEEHSENWKPEIPFENVRILWQGGAGRGGDSIAQWTASSLLHQWLWV